jgi:hypothetical protein
MELPTQIMPPIMVAPQTLVMFGATKIGKSTLLTQLPGCLIIDTELGTKYLSGLKVSVNSLAELHQLYTALTAEGAPKYGYLAIDVIDKVAEWAEQQVCAEQQVAAIGDIPYGGGYSAVREIVTNWVKAFQNVSPHLIIVGHRKRTIIGNESVEFSSSSLDLTGKLKNTIMADADAIGYTYRDDETGKLMVSFKPTDEVEAGSRCDHLKGQVIEFDWNYIYQLQNTK